MEYDDLYLIEEQEDIDVVETIETIEVEDFETYTVDSDTAFPSLGATNEELKHDLLNGKELPDQHPITAITGLREELDNIEALQTIYSDEKQIADYYEWEDGNIFNEGRIGYFVTLCEDAKTIKLCKGSDIFGITVDRAAFIGGQDDIKRDDSYGLVAYTGIAYVRCELDVRAGDCVVSNGFGVAKKTKNNYGCKVIAIGEIDDIRCAIVALNLSIDQIDLIGKDLKSFKGRLDTAEINIVNAINVANTALNKMHEIEQDSKDAKQNSIDAINKSNEAISNTENALKQSQEAIESSAEAKAIAESVATSAVKTANDALSQVTDTKENLEKEIDKIEQSISDTVAEIENTKTDIEEVRKDLSTGIEDTQKSLQSTKEELQDSIDDIKAGIGVDTKGIIDEVIKEIGDDYVSETDLLGVKTDIEESIAATKTEVSNTYATIESVTNLKTDMADAITGVEQKASETYATITSVAALDTKTSSAISTVSNVADENKAKLDAISEYKYTDKDGKTTTGLAGLKSQVDANKSELELVASYEADDGKTGMAGLVAQVNDNESKLNQIVSYEYEDENGNKTKGLAGLNSQVDNNSSNLALLADFECRSKNNLISYPYADTPEDEENNLVIIDGIEFIDNRDGTITVNGAATEDTVFCLIESLSVSTGEYFISGSPIDSSTDTYHILIRQKNADSDEIFFEVYEDGQNIEIQGDNKLSIWIRVKANTTVDNVIFEPSCVEIISKGLAGLKSQVSANKSAIDLITSFDSGEGEGTAGLIATVNEHESKLQNIATWQSEKNKSIASIQETANNNKAAIEQITKWQGDSGASLASLVQKVGKNESNISTLTKADTELRDSITNIEQKADENGASITSFVSNIDKYSVGEYSQAYGLTLEQARKVLPLGMVYIPTKHIDSETHEETYVGVREDLDKGISEVPDLKQSFTPGRSYVWMNDPEKGIMWKESGDNTVAFSKEIPEKNEVLQYWYIDSDDAPGGYTPHGLYIWDNSTKEDENGNNVPIGWKEVNVLSGNVTNRINSMIKQTQNEISLAVNNTQGDIASIQAKVDNANTSITQIVQGVGEDGEVSAASIVAAINKYDNKVNSAITLDADKINLNGAVTANNYFTIDETGRMTTISGNIGGWEINSDEIRSSQYLWSLSDVKFTVGISDVDPIKNLTLSSYKDKKGNKYLTIGNLNYIDTDLTNTGEYFLMMFKDDKFDIILRQKAGKRVFSLEDQVYGIPLLGGSFDFKPNSNFNNRPHYSGNISNYPSLKGKVEFYMSSSANYKSNNWIEARSFYYDEDGKENINSFFKVDRRGTLTATNANIEGHITASTGDIGGWTINNLGSYKFTGIYHQVTSDKITYEIGLKADTDSINNNGEITKPASEKAAFYIRQSKNNKDWTNNFYVRNDGYLYATAGKVGGWELSQYEFRTRKGTSTTKNAFYITSASHPDANNWIKAFNSEGDVTFSVGRDGILRAKGAIISGSINVEQSGTFKGTVNATAGSFSRDVKIGGRSISGWIDASGHVKEIKASSGSIGGWHIGSGKLYSSEMTVKSPDSGVEFLTRMRMTGATIGYRPPGKTDNDEDNYRVAQWHNIVETGHAYAMTDTSLSDKRFKRDITEYSDEYEEFYNLLKPVRYKYINGTSDRYHTGFIAQEVVSALEDANLTTQDFAGVMLTYPGEEDECWKLRRDEFVALNTWQIQKAKSRISELEEKVAKLETLIKEK